MRLLALLLAASLFFLALLTQVKAPTLLGWKLALLAGEYGYILCFVSVLLLVTQLHAAFGNAIGPARTLARVTMGLSASASLLLTFPPLQAWWIARTLPAKWQKNFGANSPEPFFQWGDFLRIHASPTVVPTTYHFPSQTSSLALDFYPARLTRDGNAPCIVVVHGGGWNNGDRTQLAALNSWLACRGYAVAAIDYRLVPSALWPAPREDTEAALQWLQSHAKELHLASNQFFLLGRSAGGQIALATAYGKTKAMWRGVISLYGPADLNFAYQYADENDVLHSPALLRAFLGGTPQQASARYIDASPYSYVAPDDPPTLLIHGRLDTLVWHKQSERLDARLAEVGVPRLFISLPWATHAFDVNLNGPGGQITRHAIDAFLQTVLTNDQLTPPKHHGPNQQD